jgi:major membrane immunogen (membrane-anchored lipoprotein)
MVMRNCTSYGRMGSEPMERNVIKMKKRLLAMMLALGCLMILGACNNENESNNAGENKSNEVVEDTDEDKVIATVNGTEIFQSEYDLLFRDTTATYAQQGMDIDTLDDAMKEQLKTQILDQLINTELLIQEANAEGVEPEEEVVNSRFEEMKAQFEDEAQFNQALEENNLTEESLKERIVNELQITSYLETSVGEIEVTDEEVTAVYDQYKEAMESQEQEVIAFEEIKPDLEEQAKMQKRQEKISEIIEQLRNDNEIVVL